MTASAIEQARARANQMREENAANAGAVQTYNAGAGQALSVDAAMNMGGTQADHYMKLKNGSMRIGETKVESFTARLSVGSIKVFKMLRYGNPAQYIKSRDGIMTEDGVPFQQAQETANQVEGKTVKPYISYELRFTLEEAAGDGEAGQTVVYSTPPSSKTNTDDIIQEIRNAGIRDDEDALVKVGYVEKTNKNGNDYCVLTFEFIGAADVEGDDE